MTCYLVVHEFSLPFIHGVVARLKTQLQQHYGDVHFVTVAASLDEITPESPATIFFIGERLPPFRRWPGCRYVYLNFSVVAMIGNPFATSLRGLRLIRSKRRLLEQKLSLVDAVLDYYPAQTRVLKKALSIPVMGFLPCSTASRTTLVPMAARAYDLCFVGGITPRRQRVLDQAAAAGFRLSPSKGHHLEDLTAQSRCTLNVHMQASNHLEIPRIVGALSTATPVVTERSHGLDDIVDPSRDCIRSGRIGDLIGLARSLLADTADLDRMAARSLEAYQAYAARSDAAMSEAVRTVRDLPGL